MKTMDPNQLFTIIIGMSWLLLVPTQLHNLLDTNYDVCQSIFVLKKNIDICIIIL